MLTLTFIACLKSPSDTTHTANNPTPSERITKPSDKEATDADPETMTPPFLSTVNNQTEELLTTGVIESPASSDVGDVSITYRRLYRNGCIEQEEDRFEVNSEQLTITHYLLVSDRSTEPGAMCTLALKPGGFTHAASLNKAGNWKGSVMLNDQKVTSYELTVTD